jgi:hypothetical protein
MPESQIIRIKGLRDYADFRLLIRKEVNLQGISIKIREIP